MELYWWKVGEKLVEQTTQALKHSRPQIPSFLGHVVGKRGAEPLVGYKLSRVALGTRIALKGICQLENMRDEVMQITFMRGCEKR